jgi:hypothetical protein
MRKFLTFLIALAAIAFAVCSPSSAQVGGLMFPGPGSFASSGGGGTLTFVATDTTQTWQTSGASFTFAATIGTASTDRLVVVAISHDAITGNDVSGVTINTLAMTKATSSGVSSGVGPASDIWYRMTPTSDIAGSTASIVVTIGGTNFSSDLVITVGKITGSATATLGPVANVPSASTPDAHAISATIPTNGVAVMLAGIDRNTTISWIGATKDSNINETGGGAVAQSMAHGTSSSVSFTGANNFSNSSAMATFGP